MPKLDRKVVPVRQTQHEEDVVGQNWFDLLDRLEDNVLANALYMVDGGYLCLRTDRGSHSCLARHLLFTNR